MEDAVMASLTEAYTQMFVAQLDPMNGVIKSMAQQQLATAEVQLDESKLVMMQRLQKLIDDGKANGADGNVIAAYIRMLEKYSK
jgi:hypothetical protein